MNRVLIIDDQPQFRRQLRKLLTYAGMIVVGEAENISSALKMTEELQPDFAVLDVMLPGESGLIAAPRLKALAKNMRIFLISSYHDSADLFSKSAKEIGAEAFIPKDELTLEVIRNWMSLTE